MLMLFPYGLSQIDICSRTRLTRQHALTVLNDLVEAGWARLEQLDEADATRDAKGRFAGSLAGSSRWVIDPELLLRIFRGQKRFFHELEQTLCSHVDSSGRQGTGSLDLRELARQPVSNATFAAWVRAIESRRTNDS